MRRARKKPFSGGLVSVVLGTGLAVFGVTAASDAYATDVTGAGSSFAAPVYQAWSLPFRRQNAVAVNYQSVGSSAGQDQVAARTVDFGASDQPMRSERLAQARLYQFPTVFSGVVVVVNVPGIAPGSLRLDGPALAGLYDGTITQWDDPRLRRLNPGLSLPAIDVAAVHRADGSGTSYVFTSYLSRVSADWRRTLGAGTLIAWPGGAGAHGNDGVAALVKQTPGGIGYVEYSFAAQNRLATALLKNHDGTFVAPSLDGFAQAARSVQWNAADHYAVDLLDKPGATTWPIVAATFSLVPRDPQDKETGRAVKAFFTWGLRHGGAIAASLGYVGLPEAASNDIVAHWPDAL